MMREGHEVGLVCEVGDGGVTLKAKDRSFVLWLDESVAKALRSALVERYGV